MKYKSHYSTQEAVAKRRQLIRQLKAEGWSIRDIAKGCRVSESTVKAAIKGKNGT